MTLTAISTSVIINWSGPFRKLTICDRRYSKLQSDDHLMLWSFFIDTCLFLFRKSNWKITVFLVVVFKLVIWLMFLVKRLIIIQIINFLFSQIDEFYHQFFIFICSTFSFQKFDDVMSQWIEASGLQR